MRCSGGRYVGLLSRTRRVAAKVEWHPGELYPRVAFIVTNLTRPAERVVAFYNHRGTAEQHIKEGKNAVTWTRLSCHRFAANAVRLQLLTAVRKRVIAARLDCSIAGRSGSRVAWCRRRGSRERWGERGGESADAGG